MITALVFSALLSASGADTPPSSAQGQASTVTAPTAKPVKTDAKDRMICRRDESETGSHRVVRVCHTKRDWDEMTEDAQRLFREGGIQAVPRTIEGDGVHPPH